MSCDRIAAVHGIGDDGSGHHGHHNYQLPLYGLSLLLIGGGATQHFFSGLPFPYTACLLLVGMLLGVWVHFDPAYTIQPGTDEFTYSWKDSYGHETELQCNVSTWVPNDIHYHGWHLGNSLRQISGMDPHLLLHLLLPPLLFESAFAIDWHIFSKVSPCALFLALPGLIVATSLTAGVYGAMYGWPWEACVLIGGILSATDPVAVVALLREMGVKKSLATLIEAESLLNDGTAVVVYSIFLKAVTHGGLSEWLEYEGENGGYILYFFFLMSVLGPLLGVAMGVLSVLWLELNQGADRDANVEIICTVATPFLVFYLAETAFDGFQMSGVLAVVAYGLVFASPFGKVRIDPECEHFLHAFWGMVGHLVNTVIFSLSGILIVLALTESDTSHFWEDLGYGMLSYAAMTAIRGIVMFGVIPMFRVSQYGYDWRDALVITWGGLRGAVGLALAVAVYEDGGIVDCDDAAGSSGSSSGSDDASSSCSFAGAARFKQVVLFHVCLTVVMTLLVNAPTSGPILKKIGLTKMSDEKVSMVQIASAEVVEAEKATLHKLNRHPVYSDVNWEGVQRLAGLPVMAAAMLSWPAPQHDPEKCWHPGKGGGGGHGHGHGHGHHGDGHGHGDASLSPTPTTDEAMAAAPASKQQSAEDEQVVKIQAVMRGKKGRKAAASIQCIARWKKFGNALSMAAEFVGDFKKRLHEKRLRQAKFRLLERYKASSWAAFEAGLISPATTNLLKDMAIDQMDLLEQGRHEGDNCLPFTPLRRVLVRRPLVLWLSRSLEVLRVRPLARVAQSLLFGEFRRGYDAAAGYMLVHEELLEEHGHGMPFANEAAIDKMMKDAVAANLAEVRRALAALKLEWPKMVTAINTFKASSMVLNAAKAKVNEIKHHGGLVEAESERYLDLIGERAVLIQSMPPTQALPADQRANFIPSGMKHAKPAEIDSESDKLQGGGLKSLTRKMSRRASAQDVALKVAPAPASDSEA